MDCTTRSSVARSALGASLQAFSMKMVENGESTAVYPQKPVPHWQTANVVIHSTLVADAAICVVLIFCRLTQNPEQLG